MRPEDFVDRDWSYGAEPPTPRMNNAEFTAFVADLVGEDVVNARFVAEVRDARWRLVRVQTEDMVLRAYLVAGYLLYDISNLPTRENTAWMFAMPGSYLHRVAYNRSSHDWDAIIRAARYYHAGVSAEMVEAAAGSMRGILGSSDWLSDDVIQLDRWGVTPAYVKATHRAICSAPDLAKLHGAGVPADYVMALVSIKGDREDGMKPGRIIELWEAGIPVEYALA